MNGRPHLSPRSKLIIGGALRTIKRTQRKRTHIFVEALERETALDTDSDSAKWLDYLPGLTTKGDRTQVRY